MWRWGEREIIYLLLHCHHQNDFCIKIGSDESHFNVSVGSDGQSHKTVSTNHNHFEEKGEPNRGPSAYQPNALPLGQTGSRFGVDNQLYIYCACPSSVIRPQAHTTSRQSPSTVQHHVSLRAQYITSVSEHSTTSHQSLSTVQHHISFI